MEILGQLYERYLDLLYGLCLKYLKSPEAAEDAVMSIFEQLPEKVKKHEIKSFRPWIYVLAKNYCLMQLRKKEIITPIEPAIMQSDESLHPLIEEDTQDREQVLQQLEDCIDQLQEKQKSCIQLFYLEGQSYKEVASKLGLEIGKVRSYIQNGRRNLKNCMESKTETAHETD